MFSGRYCTIFFYVQELGNDPGDKSHSLRVCLENCNVSVGEEVSGDETDTSSIMCDGPHSQPIT